MERQGNILSNSLNSISVQLSIFFKAKYIAIIEIGQNFERCLSGHFGDDIMEVEYLFQF